MAHVIRVLLGCGRKQTERGMKSKLVSRAPPGVLLQDLALSLLAGIPCHFRVHAPLENF